MIKQYAGLFFLVVTIPILPRYPFLRVGHEIGEKKITLINKSNQRIYLKLKPTHIKAECDECSDDLTHGKNVSDCCQKKIAIEYVVNPGEFIDLTLSKIKVGDPESENEMVDFTDIFYGSLHLEQEREKTYITIKNGHTYELEADGKRVKLISNKKDLLATP
jgi:hypothetical protein